MIINKLEQLKQFLETTIHEAEFARERSCFSDQDAWLIINGVLSHKTSAFFHVVGYQRNDEKERLMLYQPQNAYNGQALHYHEGSLCLLLQVRVEPGHSQIGNFGPTVQSTAGNYMRLHGGRKTAHFDLFFAHHPLVQPIVNSTQLDIGEHYIQKTKTVNLVEVEELIEPEINMAWVNIHCFQEALHEDYLINTDLRAFSATVDWDLLATGQQSDGAVTPIAAASFLGKRQASGTRGRMVPINSLSDWEITESGIHDRAGRGRSVELFHIVAVNREVARWYQPLVKVSNWGCIALFVRNWDSDPEFLVVLDEETGVSGRLALRPSYVRIGGDDPSEDAAALNGAQLIYRAVNSEEGGRFLENETVLQLYEVDPDIPTSENAFWVTPYTLKSMLRTSNAATIEMRCVCSLILAEMNPFAFSRQPPHTL